MGLYKIVVSPYVSNGDTTVLHQVNDYLVQVLNDNTMLYNLFCFPYV